MCSVCLRSAMHFMYHNAVEHNAQNMFSSEYSFLGYLRDANEFSLAVKFYIKVTKRHKFSWKLDVFKVYRTAQFECVHITAFC